jgi:glycosyltransferase involved in cell wall biosynthesis
LFKKLDEFNPDIIHIHSPFTLSQGLIRYAKKRNIPLCITIHTKFESDLPRTTHSKIITHMMMKTVKHAIQYADAVFTVNKLMAEHIKKTYKLPNIKISVVQNATEMLPYKEKEAAANEINSLYGIRPEEKVFIFISRIVTNKNIGFLVDTFKEYVKINDNFKFLVMGDGREFS